MKKKLSFVLFLFFLTSSLFCEATFFLGGIYDSFHGNDWGFEGSINADFMRDASLSAAIDYRYGSNYSMSFTADYTPSFFILGGGLDFKINKNGVYPGIKANLGVKAEDWLRIAAYGTLGINASNISSPTMFELGINSKYIVPHVAIQLNGYFSQESDKTFRARNASAEVALSIYKEGFLYSLKTGFIGEYESDTRWETSPNHLSFKAIFGVGKNKASGTLAIQLTFNVFTLLGPKASGFAVSFGLFPGQTSYIY